MSALMTCRSCMTNREGIVKALKQLGVPEDKIQLAVGQALKLQGYGRQSAEVEILVANKDYHNGYSDFGFSKKDGEKEYDIHVDDMDDVGKLASKAGVKGKFSASVTKWYTAFMAQEALKKTGCYNTKIKAEGDKLVIHAQG